MYGHDNGRAAGPGGYTSARDAGGAAAPHQPNKETQ